MYQEIRKSSRLNEQRRVIIEEVNTQQYFIVGRDSQGAQLRINFDLQNPMVSIPAPQEMWSVKRTGTGEWVLDKKLEGGTEQHPIDALAPGDRRIETSGIIYLQGEDVVINGTLFSEFADTLGTDFVTIDTTQTITGKKSFTEDANFYDGLWSSRAVYDDTALATFITGDLTARMRVRADGTLVWGDGLGAIDTNLYRLGPGYLGTDSQIYMNGPTPHFAIRPTGSAQPKFFINPDGMLHWGDGVGAQDVVLYRHSADLLRTNDSFWIASGATLALNNGNSAGIMTSPQIELAWAGGERTYRSRISSAHDAGSSAGNVIDFHVWAPPLTSTDLATARVLRLDGAGYLWIGNALDTNLYRAAADVLRTDDAFSVVGALDTYGGLFTRRASGTVAFHIQNTTDTNWRVLWHADGALWFGDGTNAVDTNLYRYAANILMSDDIIGTTVGGRHAYMGNAYTNDNGWIGGYFGGSIRWDGTNWQNENAGGNNGWAMMAVNGAAGGIDFFTEAATGASDRSYTPAQMLTKKVLTIQNTGRLDVAAAGIRFSDASVQTTAAVSSAPGYGTSFPGSPTNGQEYILVDSTTNPTYQWTFRYNSSNSTSYKWEFIGGAPVITEHGNFESESFATATPTLTSFSSTFTLTLPRAGVYMMEWGCITQVNTNGEIVLMALTGNTGSAESARGGGYNLGEFWIHRSKKYTYASANQTIQPYFSSEGGTQAFAKHGLIKATPIRCS